MTAETVLVIYSTAQKVRRRAVVMDEEGENDAMYRSHIEAMGPGESYVMIPMSSYITFQSAKEFDDYIAAVIGPPVSDYCAVVTGDGEILETLRADPRIDDHADGWIIQDDSAIAGGTYDFETATASPPEAVE